LFVSIQSVTAKVVAPPPTVVFWIASPTPRSKTLRLLPLPPSAALWWKVQLVIVGEPLIPSPPPAPTPTKPWPQVLPVLLEPPMAWLYEKAHPLATSAPPSSSAMAPPKLVSKM
jgi:hypothetical protein